MRRKILLLISLSLAACLLTGCAALPLMLSEMYPAPESPASASQESGDTVTLTREEYERYRKFDNLLLMLDTVKREYYEDVDEEALLQSAAAGLLEGIDDPYTFYYTPEDYAQLWEDDEGEYAGIGIQITINYNTKICTISRVFDGGPAFNAGVKRGDILYQVEDLMVSSDNIEEAIAIMRNTPGTQVHVTFLRNGEEMPYTLTCATVTTTRVEHKMIGDQAGYIGLYEFAGDCAEKFEEALKDLESQGAKGLVIDLRDNPGGWVSSAQAIGDLFLDEGDLCYLEFKNGERQYYNTTNGKSDIKLVLLVNENSASASEILTGALRDRANAVVVGTKTYGKGIVQSVEALQNGAGMQLTIAQYYTPSGYAVHKAGITPDVIIEQPEEDVGKIYQLADLDDIQVKTALETLEKMLAE